MGDTTNRLAGTAYVTIDGVTVMVAGQFKYSPSKVERTSLVGMDTVHGYKEKPRVPFISYQARDSGGTSIAGINDSTNVSVVVELANGKTIIGENMWSVNAQDVDSEDAVFDVRWEGGSVTEY
ncbi:phage tail tube protein [Erwinia sp. S38]|uniref:phage tail tube protein n=1 Tax=Erwinia sp. S38 TaxID=2769338 RepID=UPI00190A3841|nr:phage tail tube protein [Erwinia sp. S38]MBK0004380.1 phage tail tube protein [Erwinia sp. S38]